MIKPLTRRPAAPIRAQRAFADTVFLVPADAEGDDGFAAARLCDEEVGARSTQADAPGASAWATARWLAKQEAKAHAAAHLARGVIAAQRRVDAPTDAAPPTRLARLRAAVARLLPDLGSLLPLFIGVSVTMAMISAMLPLFDKP